MHIVGLTLKNVYVVDLQALQAGLHGVENVLRFYICMSNNPRSCEGSPHLAIQPVLVDDTELFGTFATSVDGNLRIGVHGEIQLPNGWLVIYLYATNIPITFVMITSSSRGRFNFLIAFPRRISESPFEYTYEYGNRQTC